MSEALTRNEYEVMEILWDKNEPMLNSEIQEAYLKRYPDGIKTIHNITGRLLKKGYIKEDAIIKVKKRFAQKFAVVVSADEYMQMQLEENYFFNREPNQAATALFSNLLNNDKISSNTISEMQRMLEEYKKS